MKRKILVAEDDFEIAMAIKKYLEKENYKVIWGSTGVEALEEFHMHKFDLAIIDIMMPEMDGLTLCKNIKLKSRIPVIILSAKNKELDKVEGLNIGADDYMTKPFSLLELSARVNRHIKSYESFKGKENKKILKHRDGLSIDLENNIVYLDSEKVNLTEKEYEILNLFVNNPKETFSKREIYENIWGSDLDTNTVTVHIKKLREKLDENIKRPKFIETVWGKGYRYIGERLR